MMLTTIVDKLTATRQQLTRVFTCHTSLKRLYSKGRDYNKFQLTYLTRLTRYERCAPAARTRGYISTKYLLAQASNRVNRVNCVKSCDRDSIPAEIRPLCLQIDVKPRQTQSVIVGESHDE